MIIIKNVLHKVLAILILHLLLKYSNIQERFCFKKKLARAESIENFLYNKTMKPQTLFSLDKFYKIILFRIGKYIFYILLIKR